MTNLPIPAVGPAAAEAFVAEHLHDLVSGPITGSPSIRGGQRAADAALARLDVAGYARRRNEVYPEARRGASRLSPYIRHGLLSLREVWTATSEGPARDVDKFHDELLWQEFARHWYARLGPRTRTGIRRELDPSSQATGWDRSMACVAATVDELETDGWLVNQTRMWLSSQWTIRDGQGWQAGENEFFRHLLDGSRAANRLGWQWTTGVGSSKHYGFSRWQVNKRAPGLCDTCTHRNACPIQEWPDDPAFSSATPTSSPARPLSVDPTLVAGPAAPLRVATPNQVWLTAESLGTSDPALRANPDLDAIFIFDEPLLAKLQLSAKRLVFLVETLAEISESRALTVLRGEPVELLAGHDVAVTFAPVPGFRIRAGRIGVAETHPWPWLHRPTLAGSEETVSSFSAWRKTLGR